MLVHREGLFSEEYRKKELMIGQGVIGNEESGGMRRVGMASWTNQATQYHESRRA